VSAVKRVSENARMPHRVLWLPLGVGLLVLLAGCGGSKPYTLAKTRACLAEQPGLSVSPKVDFVASTALGGAVAVKFPDNQVTIAFGLDGDEADRLATAYRRFRGRNIGIEDVLRPERNAVLLWQGHPDDEDSSAIHGCLK
jgi:hypothetical protein